MSPIDAHAVTARHERRAGWHARLYSRCCCLRNSHIAFMPSLQSISRGLYRRTGAAILMADDT